ncbi:hypothetical protein HispidOSU_026790 [Sigmodon hispidus]
MYLSHPLGMELTSDSRHKQNALESFCPKAQKRILKSSTGLHPGIMTTFSKLEQMSVVLRPGRPRHLASAPPERCPPRPPALYQRRCRAHPSPRGSVEILGRDAPTTQAPERYLSPARPPSLRS